MKKLAWLVCVFPILLAAYDRPWEWYDQRGQKRTREDLKLILQSHKIWVRHQQEGKIGHQQEGEMADFSRAQLPGADLKGADLRRAQFTTAKLDGADLTGADLTEAMLGGADLTGARLTGADLSGAQFNPAKLSGADLSGTNYEPRDNPTPEVIAYAKGLGYLKWRTNSGRYLRSGNFSWKQASAVPRGR